MVKDLTGKLTKSKALVLADYRGLAHKQLEELRKTLKKTQAELSVTKNSLLKRALNEARKTVDITNLSGSTATLFAYADEIAPIKELSQFLKTAGAGKIKGGLLGNQTLTSEEIDKLSTLPPKNVLLAQLVGQMKAPLSGLHHALSWNLRKLVWTLSAVKDKKVRS